MPNYDDMSDREINMQVHTRIIEPGCDVVTWGADGYHERCVFVELPHYSTDANAARLVGERMRELDLQSQWVSEVMRMVFDEKQPGGGQSYRMIQAENRTRCIAALRLIDPTGEMTTDEVVGEVAKNCTLAESIQWLGDNGHKIEIHRQTILDRQWQARAGAIGTEDPHPVKAIYRLCIAWMDTQKKAAQAAAAAREGE